jgi:hypothetical protein
MKEKKIEPPLNIFIAGDYPKRTHLYYSGRDLCALEEQSVLGRGEVKLREFFSAGCN